jgi:lipoate---protein ligase
VSESEPATVVVESLGSAGRWSLERRVGTVAQLHATPFGEPEASPARLIWCEPVDDAIVLGSTQRDLAPAVVERLGPRSPNSVVVRRSGGGAVAVPHVGALWGDVIVPRGDPLWDDDVIAAGKWLGECWVRALDEMGFDAELHRHAAVGAEWGRVVCFAGTGPGEVRIGRRKVVGVSQRRTRWGARFQFLVYVGAAGESALHHGLDPIISLLEVPDLHRRLVDTTAALAVTGGRCAEAFVRALEAS